MLHRLATTSRADVLIGASANHLAVFPLSDAHPDQLVASTVDRPKDEAHTGLVRTLTVYEGGDGLKLVTTAEDKALKVWDLPELKLRSSRELAKRATSVAVSDDGQRIIVADKFGDIYDFPFEAPPASTEAPAPTSPSKSKGKEKADAAPSILPIGGHVSLVTALLFLSFPSVPYPLLCTADRDEHIRLSAFPAAFHIRAYLLGSRAFVGALGWVPLDGEAKGRGWLVSGGGEEVLRVWKVEDATQVGTVEVGKLKEGCMVESQKSDWSGKRKERKTRTYNKPQEPGTTTVVEVVKSESTPMEVEQEKVPAEARSSKKTCVNKIAVSCAGPHGEPRSLCVTSAGSSTILVFDASKLPHEAAAPRCIENDHPVLDVAFLEHDRILLALDVSRSPPSVTTESETPGASKPIRLLSLAEETPEDLAIPESISSWLAANRFPAPSEDSLYSELTLLSKTLEDFSGPTDGEHPEEGDGGRPKKRLKAGQVGAGTSPDGGAKPDKGGRTGEKALKRADTSKQAGKTNAR